MKQLPSYGDVRTLAFCAFCGGETGTRDHCPSRVFLDEPFPANLPVVPACVDCNGGFSEGEEYLACLLSCVVAGSTSPDAMPREKTKRILYQKPALRARIEAARVATDEGTVFVPEHDRVRNVITKLAQGHALYELHESCTEKPAEVAYIPLPLLSDAQREAFEKPAQAAIWPEVGSRAMQRMLLGTDLSAEGWLVVQPERYRFHTSQVGGVEVRIVLHEYLACYIRWEY
jgi:hypothetical protein